MPRIVVACGTCHRKTTVKRLENPFTCGSCRSRPKFEPPCEAPVARKLDLTPLVLKRARELGEEFVGVGDRPGDASTEDSTEKGSSFTEENGSDDEGSEAGDDWKCSQIGGDDIVNHNATLLGNGDDNVVDVGSDDDNVDDRPLIELTSTMIRKDATASASSSTVIQPPTRDAAAVDDDDDFEESDSAFQTLHDANCGDVTVCLVCGSSLVAIKNLKGRLNHMKRCSRKNGVAAKDVRWNDDHEMFVSVTSSSTSTNPSPSKRAIRNPYAKHSLPGLASTAAAKESSSVSSSAAATSAPTTSVINVLMAGARQVAKRKKIEAQTAAAGAAAAAAKRTSRRGRPWWQANDDQQPKRACPRYKMVSGTDFCVDGFNFVANTQNFFLSHFHSDHYGGITSQWNSGTIYCSLVTANLVSQQLGVDRKFLHPIPLLTPVVMESQGKAVTVTAIDANHCPGAVMFLFQTGTKYVLHVGDFRWNRSVFQESPPLKPFFSGQAILDCIYLDTTYCDEKYALPTQDEAIREAIAVASRELDVSHRSKQSLLMLFGAYTIGKERIYMAVAEHLNVKVYVDPRRYRILTQLGWTKSQMDRLTTKPDETFLWVVPLGHINMKHLPSYLQVQRGSYRKTFDRVVGFRPTGWSHSSSTTKKSGSPRSIISTTTKGKISVHGVPYSEHSSFPELVDCLRCLKPKRIVPTVSVSKSQQQVELLLRALSKPSGT